MTVAGTLGGTIIAFTFPGIVAIKEKVYKGPQQLFLIIMTTIVFNYYDNNNYNCGVIRNFCMSKKLSLIKFT